MGRGSFESSPHTGRSQGDQHGVIGARHGPHVNDRIGCWKETVIDRNHGASTGAQPTRLSGAGRGGMAPTSPCRPSFRIARDTVRCTSGAVIRSRLAIWSKVIGGSPESPYLRFT